MDKIMMKDIEFSKLTHLSVSTSESDLYFDEDYIYKIFKMSMLYELDNKLKKLNVLASSEIPNVLGAKKLIFNTIAGYEKFVGYFRDYINGETLSDYFLMSDDIPLFLKIVKEVSMTLRTIHKDPRNIIVGDLQFGNILIDSEFRHYFIDFDSCIIDGLPTHVCADSFYDYSQTRKVNIEQLTRKMSQTTDKLCLFQSFIFMLFGQFPDYVNINEYDELAEQIKSLKNMRDIFLKISDKGIFVPDVPYIDELISDEDISKKIVLQ